MALFGFAKKEKGINGIIRYLGLADFWQACSSQEQKDLIRYYSSGFSTGNRVSPIEGNVTTSSETPLKYLSSMLGWVIKEKNYPLAEKIVSTGKQIPITERNLIDAHFFYQEAAECYYKQRETNPNAILLSMDCCERDINLFPNYAPLMKNSYGSLPRIVTFSRLIGIYEKCGRKQDAILLCKKAIEYGLTDNTKGGFPAKLAKLEKSI